MPALAPLIRLVPIWAWVLLAALAWGGWQRHNARAAAAELADVHAETARLRERGTAASLAETQRRLEAQGKVARDATATAARHRADAASAAGAAGQLLEHAAGLAARAVACDSSAAGDRAAAADAARMHAELLRRAVERSERLAVIADERGRAGDACVGTYEALRAP